MTTPTYRPVISENALTSRAETRMRIGALLCQKGLITKEQLECALERQRRESPKAPIGQILIEMKAIVADQLTEALAESMSIPYMVLVPEVIQASALNCLPVGFLEEHNLLPLSIIGDRLTIAVDHFADLGLIEDIGRLSGLQVQVIAAESNNIVQTRNRVLKGQAGLSEEAATGATGVDLDMLYGNLKVEQLKVVEDDYDITGSDLDAVTAVDSPIIALVNGIIQHAVEAGASDIHIEPDHPNFRVRYRIDGDLAESLRLSAKLLPAVVSRIKILAGMDISERRLPQDGGITVTLLDRPIDLRISTMATKFGEKVVMRIVDRQGKVRSLDAVGLECGTLARFRAVIRDTHGIVIVTGPTGSGKTSTLYSALSEIISVKHNVSTIEDPVERRISGTNQFQVNSKAGFTFASALRSLLRQDPDVVMVGEIRDPETAKLATEAALTGHLVLTTLHTNDAPTAVPRLVNMGVEPYLVAASLRGVLAQRLVRRLCPHCRQSVPLTADKKELLLQLCNGSCPVESDHVGAGCSLCRNTGFAGRTGVFELLLLNEELLTAVARDPNMRGVQDIARRQGQGTLLDDALSKVRGGIINVESLLDVVSRADVFTDKVV